MQNVHLDAPITPSPVSRSKVARGYLVDGRALLFRCCTTSSLSASELAGIAALEERVLAVDGGRLKLEWSTLHARSGPPPQDLLCWDADRLVGFAGLYSFSSSVEVTGMVDPAVRGQGIGTMLLERALTMARERGAGQVLLVVPRNSAAGRHLAHSRGGVPAHSEHALRLVGPPHPGPSDPATTIRTATTTDALALNRLLQAAFGHPGGEPTGTHGETTIVAERCGQVVGVLRLSRHGDHGGVYGFAVDAAWRGRGIGRDVLRRACHQLHDSGVREIGLEVEATNDRALSLYTSLGFAPVTTEDYYAVSTSSTITPPDS